MINIKNEDIDANPDDSRFSFEEDPDRTTIVLRDEGCDQQGLGRLLPSAENPIPYKGYTLSSVAQYVLVRMTEDVSWELATKMMQEYDPSIGFARIEIHLREDYDPDQFVRNSADIYCYMVEAYHLLAQLDNRFMRTLLMTGDALILTYEHSWINAQWGARPLEVGDEEQVVWSGENIVGRALEDVRERLILDRMGSTIWGDEGF